MILMSSLIRFWQEYRSNKAALKLMNLIKTTATVIRNGDPPEEIDLREIVPGDLVRVRSGDMIPGDCRIIDTKDLFVSQSMLSGESLPVLKQATPGSSATSTAMLDLENIAFMGTNVVSGSGLALILSTGSNTYFGSIHKALSETRGLTHFESGINQLSWLLIRFILILVPLVFIINGITKGVWIEAFLFSITIAVGITPEMLPLIVTTNLAKGAWFMSKKHVIVKNLSAIQQFGAMDVLCTDKTGTLTINKIVLQLHHNILGEDDLEVFKWSYLNSYHQTSLKNALDVAILEHEEAETLRDVWDSYQKIDEIPFDYQRRRMSVVVKPTQGPSILICKGALEELLPLCTHAFDPGSDHALHVEQDTIIPLSDQVRQQVTRHVEQLHKKGLRVLLVAIAMGSAKKERYTVDDERNLVLTGYIGFLDPPKPSAQPAIKGLRALGVSVKVLTGDNEQVSKKICQMVGIPIDTPCLLGADIEQMSDDILQKRVETTTLFAKLDPFQKQRVVRLLKSNGHTVGFLGDGINDAPALREVDVGISVDDGADIAKESGDIILLEKDLLILKKGIIYGRRTFGNIMKYIKMATCSNFGNMISVVAASLFFPFLPLLPIQVITQNLLYDISQISIPWDKMDRDYVTTPPKWDIKGIQQFMVFVGPSSSLFDFLTFYVLYSVFKATSVADQTIFQTGWFMEGLLSQTLIIHLIRTRHIPFFQSMAAPPVLWSTVIIMAIGVYLPYSPLAPVLSMQPMPMVYFVWLLGILLGYSFFTFWIKTWYLKKFKDWL